MSKAPYVPFYTSDFLAGTGGMTASTKGIYITLLCLMYEAEEPLTQSWATLARRCGCTPSSFKKAIAMLEDEGKVIVSDDGIWSDKCEKHITCRRDRSNSASVAAKKRWEKTEQKQRKDDASAMRSVCLPEPEPEPEPKESKDSPKPPHNDGDLFAGPDTSVITSNPEPVAHANDASKAVAMWNETAARVDLPAVQKISRSRLAAVAGRLRDAGGLEGWSVAMGKVERSDFLSGRVDARGRGQPWRATFDWITKQNNFAKLMEGNYDNQRPAESRAEPDQGRAGDHPEVYDIIRAAARGTTRRDRAPV